MKPTIPSIIKYLQENWLPIITIIFVALIVWHKIPSQVPNGEGYFYFARTNAIDYKYFFTRSLLNEYSLLAKIYFAILMPVFKNNLISYMVFQLATMLMVYQTLYFVIVKITKDKIMSFLTTLFFLANYVGSLTMLGIGSYHRFVQRVPNLIPVFISFYFLTKYLEKRKTKYLFLLLILYTISIVLSHYNVFLLPIFAIYPFVYALINKRGKLLIRAFSLSLFFVLSSILLTRGDSLSRPNDSIFEFIKKTPQLTEMVLYQVSAVTFPQKLTIYLSKLHSPPIPYPYLATQKTIIIFMLIIFTIAILRGRKYPKIFPLFLTFVISFFILSLMMLYAYNTNPNPLKFFGEDRMYFVHSILIAFIWATLLKFFFGRNKIIYKATALLIGAIFLITNISLIREDMNRYQYRSNIYKSFINYIKNLSPSFNDKTVIVAPADLIRSTDDFIRKYYNLDKATFVVLENGWRELVAKTKADKKNVFVLDYKYNYDSKNDIDSLSVTIVDKSADFRLGKKAEPIIR